MILHRLVCVLAIMTWALASVGASAWAHPEPASITAAPAALAASSAPLPGPPAPEAHSAPATSAAPHPAPPGVALAAGALVLLAMLPWRRRALALGLVLALTIVVLEGVSHAVLHLGHVAHADKLLVGASPLPLAVDEPHTDARGAMALALRGPAPDGYQAPAAGCIVRSVQGRSPPALHSS